MQFAEIEICQFAGELWEMVLGLEIRRRSGASAILGRVLVGAVTIEGAWRGQVVFECPEDLARLAASIMLGERPADVSERDASDAVRELTNITAGNLKSILPGPCTLGVPDVTAGSFAPDEVLTRIAFDCGGATFAISLTGPRPMQDPARSM